MNLLIADFLFVDAHKDMNINFINAIAEFAKVDVASLNGFYDAQEEEFRRLGIDIKDTKIARRKGKIGSRIFSLELMIKESEFLKYKNYDAVLCLGFETTLFGLCVSKFQKRPIILFHHKNIDELTNKTKRRAFDSYKNKVYHVVFEESFKHRLIEEIGVSRDKVFIIPHPAKPINEMQSLKKYDCIGLCNSNDEKFIDEVFERSNEFDGLHVLLRSKYKEEKSETIEVIKGFLDETIYNELMAMGKAVFVPLPESYIYRLSGSIYDALSRNKVVYTTSKFYAEEYERRYPGTCYYVRTVDDLIDMLKYNKASDAKKSFQKFLDDHSIDVVKRNIESMINEILKGNEQHERV